MADFWKSIIQLGEEKAAPQTSSTSRDLDSLSQSELVTLCSDLQVKHAAKCKEYDQLSEESAQLRTEYDAFRRKAESWQQQMKVLREDDRRLIEQLRSAKQDGEDTDAVMTQALQETVTKLKEELKACQSDLEKETRRRHEADLVMKRLEQENAREVDTLKKNFETLKQKLKKQEEIHENEISVLKKKNDDLSVALTNSLKNNNNNNNASAVSSSSSPTTENDHQASSAATPGRVKDLITKLNAAEKALAIEKKKNSIINNTHNTAAEQQQETTTSSSSSPSDSTNKKVYNRDSSIQEINNDDHQQSLESSQDGNNINNMTSSGDGSNGGADSNNNNTNNVSPDVTASTNNNNIKNHTDAEKCNVDHEELDQKIVTLTNEVHLLKKTNGDLSEKILLLASSHDDALRDAQASSKRKLEVLEIEKQEVENLVAQLRSKISSLETKCSSLEATLEEKDDALAKEKRQWQQQRESMEQTVQEEKSLRAKAVARLESQIGQLNQKVVETEKIVADKDQRVSDVAEKSKAAAQEIEVQRAQLEAIVAAQEAKMQEVNSRRIATESSLAEALQEIRKRNALVDDVRQELDRTSQRLEEADTQAMILQKTLTQREQEALDKNRKIQALELDLENEKRQVQLIRHKNDELIIQLETANVQLNVARNEQQRQIPYHHHLSPENSSPKLDEQQNNNNDDSRRRQSSSSPENNNNNNDSNNNNNNNENDRWASATREWLARLDHERNIALEAVRVREEQSAKMRQLESKVDELTFKLAASEAVVNQLRSELKIYESGSVPSSSSNNHSSSSSSIINIPGFATASSVLLAHNNQPWVQRVLPAVQRISTGVLAWNRKALAVALGLLFLLVLIFNWIAASQTSVSTKQNEYEMTLMKYTQCIDALARCKKV